MICCTVPALHRVLLMLNRIARRSRLKAGTVQLNQSRLKAGTVRLNQYRLSSLFSVAFMQPFTLRFPGRDFSQIFDLAG